MDARQEMNRKESDNLKLLKQALDNDKTLALAFFENLIDKWQSKYIKEHEWE